jgi:hypothetical protein
MARRRGNKVAGTMGQATVRVKDHEIIFGTAIGLIIVIAVGWCCLSSASTGRMCWCHTIQGRIGP